MRAGKRHLCTYLCSSSRSQESAKTLHSEVPRRAPSPQPFKPQSSFITPFRPRSFSTAADLPYSPVCFLKTPTPSASHICLSYPRRLAEESGCGDSQRHLHSIRLYASQETSPRSLTSCSQTFSCTRCCGRRPA